MKAVSYLLVLFLCCFHATFSEYVTTKIADNVYSFADPQIGYYSMFIVTDAGVIAIEPMDTAHATKYLVAIKNVTDMPVKYLLISHNHWDHSSGGQIFKDVGAKTLVHAEAYEWMQVNVGKDMIVPDESWDGKRKDITLGNTTLQLYYLGMNHGLGMTVFLLPQDKIAYIADLVIPNRLFFSIVPDFNLKELERTLGEILQLDFDRAIYAHNHKVNATQGGTKNDTADVLQFIQDLRSETQRLLQNSSIGPFNVAKTLRLPKYKDWAFYDAWLEMNVWRIITDEFLGPYPWRVPRIPVCHVEMNNKSMCKMESAGIPTCKVKSNGSSLLTVSLKFFFFVLVSFVTF